MDKNWDTGMVFEMQSSKLDINLMKDDVVYKEQEYLDVGMKYRQLSIVPSRSALAVYAWHRTWYCYTIRCERYD